MELFFAPFVLIASVPGLAFVPALLVALVARRSWPVLGGFARMLVGTTAALWMAYAVYETAMFFWMRTVVAPIRIDLLLIAPLLTLATIMALIMCWRAGRARREDVAAQDDS